MTYFEALYHFTLQFDKLENIDYTKKNLVFLGASALVGMLMIILDFIAYYLKQKSFLGMHYNAKSNYFLILSFWTFACLGISYLGIILNIFNTTIQSCVIVGGSWILLATKIVNQKIDSNEKQQ